MKQIIFKSLVVRSLVFIVLIMSAVSASAQYYMDVFRNDGQKYQFLVSSIDSVRISDSFDSNPIGPTSVVITFVANGGVGEMLPVVVFGENYILPANTFTSEGYEFTGWNTEADGSGVSYYNKQLVTLVENMALYAQWELSQAEPTQVTVSFVANGGVGEMFSVVALDENYVLPANTFTSEGYEFIGWNTKADGTGNSYSNEQTITVTENLVLYAQWELSQAEPTQVTVSFVANGGEGEMSQIVSSAESLTLPANAFTYEGYEFTGWNTNADGSGTSYSNEQSITVAENIVLYAQWKEILIEAEEQVFIGVVAFNKMVNQLPITSNLEKVKSFISTQKNDYDFTAFAYSVSKGNLMFDAEGLPEFDNIFMLNFSDGTDNYSNMLWGNENRMIPLANVYDTVQYDLTGRPGLNSYALGFGDDVGFSGKMQKVVTGKGGYYNAKSSADLQTTFNDIAESIIASSQNVVLQTNPGYYSEIMGYKYFRFIFEADGIKDTLDAKMEGMPNTGYTLTVMRSTNNYAHFDEPAIGTIDETTGKVKIPLNNLTFTYEGEELQYEYEILFSPDDELYYEDVEEASTSEDIAKRIAVVMVLDCSTSMGSAFEPMKDAANDFIDILEGMISEPRTDSLYVSFNANGGEGDMANIEFVKGETVTVSINTFTRVGYKFIGWNTKADGTGLSYTENEPVQYLRRNLKLYAQWEYDPYNGYEYVDLGLPSGLKWATCNVGAYSPENYGSYFAWGETEPKSDYSWSTYKHCNNGSSSKLTKYNVGSSWGTVDNITTLELEDDAAHVNWGGAWRMPTYNDWNELKNNCAWTWTTLNGVKGYKVVSKSNGNSIFLPAAGYRNDSDVYPAGSYGGYWSSSLDSGNPKYAYSLRFHSGNVEWYSIYRYYSRRVRAVCP